MMVRLQGQRAMCCHVLTGHCAHETMRRAMAGWGCTRVTFASYDYQVVGRVNDWIDSRFAFKCSEES